MFLNDQPSASRSGQLSRALMLLSATSTRATWLFEDGGRGPEAEDAADLKMGASFCFFFGGGTDDDDDEVVVVVEEEEESTAAATTRASSLRTVLDCARLSSRFCACEKR